MQFWQMVLECSRSRGALRGDGFTLGLVGCSFMISKRPRNAISLRLPRSSNLRLFSRAEQENTPAPDLFQIKTQAEHADYLREYLCQVV
jgi:hypothetical protein